MSRLIHSEVSAAIRALLASIPAQGVSAQQRADYQIRKAEVLDLIAAVEPCLSAQAAVMAARARHEARAIAVDY